MLGAIVLLGGGVLVALSGRPEVAIGESNVASLEEQLLRGAQGIAVLSSLALLRRKPVAVTPVFKLTHLLPTILQLTIFSYWFLHWPPGRALIPQIALLAALALPLDCALSVLLRGSWRVSFGPLPVVLSTNLFAQFFGGDWWMAMVAVTVALATKHGITRPDGRHVFNPSAIGLTLVAAYDLATGGAHTPDFAAEFAMPPNMPELILTLALIVQLRLRLVLITLSASLGLELFGIPSFISSFGVVWPPMLLVLCLLITDPATIPKSPGGQALFGLTFALVTVLLQAALVAAGYHDFWAKVGAVPVVNFLSPRFDVWARTFVPRLGRWGAWLREHDKNRRLVTIWVALAVLLLFRSKGGWIEENMPDAMTEHPCFVSAPEGSRCDANPLFCRPFSIVTEVQCHGGGLAAPDS